MGSDPIMLRPGILSLGGREGGAFEGASWHAGKLTRGFNRRGQAVTKFPDTQTALNLGI